MTAYLLESSLARFKKSRLLFCSDKVFARIQIKNENIQLLLLGSLFVFSSVKQRESSYRSLSCNAETKDFARLTSHPVRGWTGKNKTFCSPGTQTGGCVIKVYSAETFPR